MRYLTLLALLALALPSCTMKMRQSQFDKQRIRHPDMTQLVVAYSVELEHSQQVILGKSRIYCSDDGDRITGLRLDFESQNIHELCQARDQLVTIVDGYLKRINEHVLVREKLARRPFTADDLEVHITYGSYFIKHVDPTYISSTVLEDGVTYFYDGELEEPHTDVWSQKVEPYIKTRQYVIARREAEKPFLEAIEEQRRQTYLKDERFVN